MLRNVLLPLDGSPIAECVLPHAVAMAQPFGARVTLIRVLEESRGGAEFMVDPLEWQMWKAEGQAYLSEVAARLHEAGVDTESVLLEGQAAERVVEYIHGHDVDMTIVSSHGWSGISAWNLGSVAQKIFMGTRSSTMIVRALELCPEELTSTQYRRLLVPLDGSSRAEVVLSWVAELARYYESHVILAYVVRPPEMPSREPLSQDEIDLIDQVTERNRERAGRYMEELEARLNLDSETRLLVGRNVATTLQELAERDQVDLMVLCAHGHSAEGRLPYGSTTLNFVTHATSPLLVVQDLAPEAIRPIQAELATREKKGH
ncbi:MAG: universal stress protein [Anaerolineae bacterium]